MSNGPSLSEAELQLRKWLHEQKQRTADRAHDKSREFRNQANQAAIEGGNLALRMALLINGGAAVALLTFIGGLPAQQKQAIAATLDWFAGGVAAAVLALALAYFTNYAAATAEGSKEWRGDEPPYVVDTPASARWMKLNKLCHRAAVIIGFGSLVLFIVGMLSVRAALTKLA